MTTFDPTGSRINWNNVEVCDEVRANDTEATSRIAPEELLPPYDVTRKTSLKATDIMNCHRNQDTQSVEPGYACTVKVFRGISDIKALIGMSAMTIMVKSYDEDFWRGPPDLGGHIVRLECEWN